MSQPVLIPDPDTMNALIRMAHAERSAAIKKLTQALYARLAARALSEPPAPPREWVLGRPDRADRVTSRCRDLAPLPHAGARMVRS